MNLKTEKTITIPIKDFAKKKICDGQVYLKTKEGRRFYILKPGILIDPNFVKKHASQNSVFEFIPLTDENLIQKFQTLFRELKYLHFEKDLKQKSSEIIQYFIQVHTEGAHFLNFVIACYEEFCQLPQESIIKMHETDIHYFRKSIYSAAFSIILGLANDFYHYPMLKDFYNVTMTLDFGICDENYSYYVAQACNHENKHPGQGKEWLKEQKATSLEIDVFLKHPERSYAFLKSSPNILSFPELSEIVLYQHELAKGKGFPRGVSKALVSSWEAVVILADSLVEIQDEYHFEMDVINYIYGYQNQKLIELPVNRVFEKLKLALDHFRLMRGAGT